FRETEHQMLGQVLGRARTRRQPTVVALGGGTLAQAQNQPIIRDGATTLIWLDCPLEILLLRCVNMPNRPLFRDEKSFRDLYAQRLPFYEQADYRVASDTDPRIVVEQILALGIFERVSV
ncbi:MAG TPA: shikimate kinase, partial [Candidatus Acidoferrales bacterium]